MDGSSGLIIAFLVVAWAAYFVPLVLRRYDEVSKNESVDAGANRKTLASVDSRASRPVAPSVPNAHVETEAPRPRITRQAEIIAARRRRNTLLTLVASLAAVVGVAAAGIITWWWVAAPVFLIAAWLVACRLMVRNERGMGKVRLPKLNFNFAAQSHEDSYDEELTEEIHLNGAEPQVSRVASMWDVAKAKVSSVRSTAGRVATKSAPIATGVDTEATIVVTDQLEEYDPDTRHVMEKDVPLGADALDEQLQIAVPSVATVSGDTLWDPLPVTVPTYVTKPRAGRTVRTIDFSQPGTWTSGHIEGEQTELPGVSGTRGDEADGTHRKAVGH